MSNEIMNFDLTVSSGSIIKVIGVGGGGGNAVNHMYYQGIRDVDFMVCNTDAQALINSPVPFKVQLGSSLTEGRGAGNKPETGRDSAIENIEDVKQVLRNNTKMVFITAGMGGGTGTGGAPVIAQAARELGILTVGIVTIPFRNEGRRRIKQAIEGIAAMEAHVDSLLVINNERIREMYGDSKISDAFAKADNILTTAAKGIAEIITVPGYINVDFADVETVMRNSGVALMGTGIASGVNRAVIAVEQALNSPLLNNNDIMGARNILLNITSGIEEITMDEIGDITDFVQEKAGNSADLIWGNGVDESLGDKISVTIIATGFSTSSIPEMAINQNQEKTYHTLLDDASGIISKVKTKTEIKSSMENELYGSKNVKQKTFEFEINTAGYDEFEELYGNNHSKKEYNAETEPVDFTQTSEETVDELENIPAYRRKNSKLFSFKKKVDEKFSRFSISPDENNEVVLRDNNSYLHDNVD
jgi:cell division protein FtsZ